MTGSGDWSLRCRIFCGECGSVSCCLLVGIDVSLFLRRLLPGGVDNVRPQGERDEDEFSASSQTPLRQSTLSLPRDPPPILGTRYGPFPAGYTILLTPKYRSAPDRDMLNHLKEVYYSRIHLQPLPLLDPEDLEQLIEMRSREYLMNSFCALTILSSEGGYHGEQRLAFAQEHADSARNVVNSLASEASSQPDVLQALCLLALYDMKRT